MQRHAEASRRATEEAFERRGLHLWGILAKDYLPSLITVRGAEHYLLVNLPEDLGELPNYELLQEVGEIVEQHYRDERRCCLAGYEFRRSMQGVYRFTVD